MGDFERDHRNRSITRLFSPRKFCLAVTTKCTLNVRKCATTRGEAGRRPAAVSVSEYYVSTLVDIRVEIANVSMPRVARACGFGQFVVRECLGDSRVGRNFYHRLCFHKLCTSPKSQGKLSKF